MEVWVNAQIYPMPLRYMSSLFSHNINKWHHGVFLLIMILMNTHINIYRILPRCLPKQNDHVWADLRMLRHTSDRWHRVQMCHWLHAKCTENAAFRADQTQTRCFSQTRRFSHSSLSPYSYLHEHCWPWLLRLNLNSLDRVPSSAHAYRFGIHKHESLIWESY